MVAGKRERCAHQVRQFAAAHGHVFGPQNELHTRQRDRMSAAGRFSDGAAWPPESPGNDRYCRQHCFCPGVVCVQHDTVPTTDASLCATEVPRVEGERERVREKYHYRLSCSLRIIYNCILFKLCLIKVI